MKAKKQRIMVSGDTDEEVRKYAKEKGLRVPRARGLLIEEGLKAVREK